MKIIYLLLFCLICSCNITPIHHSENKNKSDSTNKVLKNFNDSLFNTRDTLEKLLDKFGQKDTFEFLQFHDNMRFQLSFLKIGNFITANKKSAIMIYTSRDKKLNLELYYLKNNKWTLTDKKGNIDDEGWLVFFVNIDDYNFDNINDIYINISVSNGLGLTRGYLFTVSNDGHLSLHPETSNIADMKPIKTKKVIEAKLPWYYDDVKTTCDLTYIWVNDSLILRDKKCK